MVPRCRDCRTARVDDDAARMETDMKNTKHIPGLGVVTTSKGRIVAVTLTRARSLAAGYDGTEYGCIQHAPDAYAARALLRADLRALAPMSLDGVEVYARARGCDAWQVMLIEA